MADLAKDLLLAVELELIPRTPGDDHSRPAARAATVAVLRTLSSAGYGLVGYANRDVGLDALADRIEKGESRG